MLQKEIEVLAIGPKDIDNMWPLVEFQIKECSVLLGNEIKNSKLPENTYIGAVVRKEKVIWKGKRFSADKDSEGIYFVNKTKD